MSLVVSSLSFCEDPNSLKVMKILGTIITIIKVLVPVILIIVGIIKLSKVVASGEDTKNAINSLIIRVVIGFLIFFIPTIIYVFMNKVRTYENVKNKFVDCGVCLTGYNSIECQNIMNSASQKKETIEKEKAAEAKAKEEKARKAAEKRRQNNNGAPNASNNASVSNLLSQAKQITDYVRANNFTYGDASINPAIDHSEKKVSCDRCVAWFLYNVGFTNQPREHGVVVSSFPAWCEQNGFTKITNINDIKAGDVVFVNPDSNGNPKHTFLLGNKVSNSIWERYDCGSLERIRLTGQYSGYSSQPFKEPIAGFMYAYRMPGA